MSPWKRNYFIVCFVAIILAILWSFSLRSQNTPLQDKVTIIDTPATAKNYGGAFTLTDHTGQEKSSNSFDTDYKLVFFGFTHCPDICPIGLDTMAQAIDDLDEDSGRVQPIFITIDPARDTPAVIKEYISAFHDRFYGFTGTKEDLDKVQKNYKVFAQKVVRENMPAYQMDHSGHIYLTDRKDQVIKVFSSDAKFETITEGILKIITEDTATEKEPK